MTIKEIIAKRESALELLNEANEGMEQILNSRRWISTEGLEDLTYQQDSLLKLETTADTHLGDFKGILIERGELPRERDPYAVEPDKGE